jgi:putative hemolysin
MWQVFLQLFLISVNAVFACAEIAIISINDKKLAKMAASGDKRASRLLYLTGQPARFLSVIQVGITFAGFLGSAFAADNFASRLTASLVESGINVSASKLHTISVIVITLILSYFTLVLGELVPKRIAMRNAEKIGLAMSGFITFVSKLFAPIVWLLTLSTNSLLRLVRIDPNADDEEVSEEEIRLMVDVGSEKGVIDSQEREFIHNLFDFDDKTAEEIMTHRTKVSVLWIDESIEQWENTITQSVHTIYPVCKDDMDDVIGILNMKDYFRLRNKAREAIIEHCIKSAFFIPESIHINVLFENMKKSRSHFAIVIDEYGGMSGIITMNDLLEELVGDLEDDASAPEDEPPIVQIDSKTWEIRGFASLKVVSEQIGISFPDDDIDTFGGLVFDMLGTIPSIDDKPETEGFGLKIQVLEVNERRLEKALVQLSEKE